MQRTKSTILGMLLATGGVCLGLIATEVVLRVLRWGPAGSVHTVTSDDFERIPGIFAANQLLVDRSVPSLPHRVRINALGFRGDELPLAKPTGEGRILMVGDSFTYGYLVGDDETLPAQLQRLLTNRYGDRIRVINAGLGGSSVISAHHIALRGLAVHPDLVVLTFSENDVRDLASTEAWEDLARNRAAKSQFPLSWVYPIARDLALWDVALRFRARVALWGQEAVLRRAGREPDAQTDTGEDPDFLRARYTEEFNALRRDMATHEVPLLFVLFPSHYRLGESDPERLLWAESVGRNAGVPVVNLLPHLTESGLSSHQLFLLPTDGHPSAAAYAIAATVLADRIWPILRPVASDGTPSAPAAPFSR